MNSIRRLSACAFTRKKATPTMIERKYVYATYDIIAEHFDHTRFARWPKVKAFLNSLQQGSIVLDVGCGNSKYHGINDDLYLLGTDRSLKLLETSKKKLGEVQLVASDAVKLPIKTSSCDAAIMIAVLHHLSNRALRLQALQEMVRILREGGRGLVYVWCSEQNIKNKQAISDEIAQKIEGFSSTQDILVNWHLQDKFCRQDDTLERVGEKNSYLVKRFYHLFREGELEGLFREIHGVTVLNSSYDKENWSIEIIKTV